MSEVNVGIIGATGLVGQNMLSVLRERHFPVGDLRLFASERSAGQTVSWQDRDLIIENAGEADFSGLDLVLLSAGGETSRLLAPKVAADGAIAIDNSSAWRKDMEVPLVVAGVNDEALNHIPKGIVANPNCTTMVAMPVMKPLHDAVGLQSMVVTSLQAASGAGQKGINELETQVRQNKIIPSVFPEPIAGNVIPRRGNMVDDRHTDEELKLLNESRRILAIGDLAVSATCWSVPVYIGHSLSIEAGFEEPIHPEQAEELLRNTSETRLVDVPTPLQAEGGDVTLVGRIRQSNVFGHHGLSLCLVGDNLRKGAALNAVQIAELLNR